MKHTLERKDIAKYLFIFNALQDGWTIKKKGNSYVFTKHKGKEKEVYMDSYLNNFLEKYMNLEIN